MKRRNNVWVPILFTTCVAGLGCSHDAVPKEPEQAVMPAPAEASSSKPDEPTGELVVEESIRVSCNLPNDQEKAPKFDYDQAELRDRGKGILDGVARCLNEGPMKGESVTIVGHADPRGSEGYNQQLGRARAEAARNYLVAQAVSTGRLRVESVGETQATGTDTSGWSADRRVEVRRGSVAP